MTTFDEGLMRTWRLPLFSALERVFRQSARADIFVMAGLFGAEWA